MVDVVWLGGCCEILGALGEFLLEWVWKVNEAVDESMFEPVSYFA
jgi:hypothetical protein